MWDNIIEFIKAIEPLIIVIIPLIFGIWLKLKSKLLDKKIKVNHDIDNKKQEEFLKWQHEESMKTVTKLKEICNFYADTYYTHTAFIQLENGTLATSKLCNMFFSCSVEDTRYSPMLKLIHNIQRIPYIQMSDWFNKILNSENEVVYMCDKDNIDEIFYNQIGVRCMMASLVHDAQDTVIGVGIFMSDVEHTKEQLNRYNPEVKKFISSLETTFLNYNTNMKIKRKELGMLEEGD